MSQVASSTPDIQEKQQPESTEKKGKIIHQPKYHSYMRVFNHVNWSYFQIVTFFTLIYKWFLLFKNKDGNLVIGFQNATSRVQTNMIDDVTDIIILVHKRNSGSHKDLQRSINTDGACT